MSKSKLVILPMLLALILFVGFFYGFLVGHDQIFPFEILSDINKSLNTKSYDSPEPRLQIYQDLSSIDELISIKTYTDIVNKRQLLIDYIWVDNNFPSESTTTTPSASIPSTLFATSALIPLTCSSSIITPGVK